MSRPRLLLSVVVLLVAGAGGGAYLSWRCPTSVTTCARIVYHRTFNQRQYDLEAAWEVDGSADVDFYGIQYLPPEEYDRVDEFGINAVLQDFPIDAPPSRWIEHLDAADAAGLKVVAWLWTPGWTLDRDAGRWDFDERAISFLNTVEDHPALLAVYATHEAYWNECFDCGYTTTELQTLYQQIKEQADVPVYSSFSEFHFWAEMGSETTFADGVCDYCDTWYYPVLGNGEYDRDGYRSTLERELATFRTLAPNSKFIWVLQSFGAERWERSLPTAEELADMAAIASTADIDGIWYYPWYFDENEYDVVLGSSPELQAVIGPSAEAFTIVAEDADETIDEAD